MSSRTATSCCSASTSDRLGVGGDAQLAAISWAPAPRRWSPPRRSFARKPKWRANPFSLGIASGDPAPDGFVIWTRLAPEPLDAHGGMAPDAMPVAWEVASDEAFATIVAKGEAPARPELAHSVHVELAGLQPDRPYFYRFTAAGERSGVGRARTLPLAERGSPPAALRNGRLPGLSGGLFHRFPAPCRRGARIRLPLRRLYLRIWPGHARRPPASRAR